MKAEHRPTISARLYLDAGFLPVATAFVEKGAAAMGLGRRECLALTLATEEIFACICRQGQPGQPLGIDLVNGGYCVEAAFELPGPALDLRAFNLTACVLPEDEASLQDLGLLVASRSADRFHVAREPGERLRLVLVKDRAYPRVEVTGVPGPGAEGPCKTRTPDAEELKLLVREVKRGYPACTVPAAFDMPGKVVDMVACGEYQVTAAVDAAGRIGGGIFWRRAGAGTVECFGPYLLASRAGGRLAVDLLESCISAIARLPRVLGLISCPAPGTLPLAHFEYLGSLTRLDDTGTPGEMRAYFRQLHEDAGACAWSHPSLEPFLGEQYRRLVLPREVRLVEDCGEARNPFSVLRTEIDRPRGEAVLRPALPGSDQEANLRRHVDLLLREGVANIYGILDLGSPHEAQFIPAFLAAGFEPRLLVPYGGEGDRVVFQPGGAPT